MAAAQRFSTEGMRVSDRLSFWNAGAVAIGGVEVEQMAAGPFSGTVVRRTLGAATVFAMSTSPHRAAWTARQIRQGGDTLPLRLWFQQRGTTVLDGHGGERTIGPGEWFISDCRRPHVSLHPGPSRKIALQLPADRLLPAERDALRTHAVHGPVRGGIAQMLRACLETSLADFEPGDERIDSDLGETMIDFCRLLIRDTLSGTSAASMRDLTQDRIRTFIRRNLGNPALSVDMVAQAMKCSKRYIHKVFRGDQTVSDYIWSQRLERCKTILCEPGAGEITLTQLAFDSGFSSSAHFSRAFRDRYGVPPKQFRAQMLADGSRRDKMTAHGAASQAG